MAKTQQLDHESHARDSGDNPERLGELLTYIAYWLFVLTNILSVCAVKLGVGEIPFRMWTLLGAGALLVVVDGKLVARALDETAKLLAFITMAALIGFAVSIIARAPLVDVVRQLVQIHVQAIIGVVVGYALILRFGVPRVLFAFLIAYAITASFAIGQALGITGAWPVREQIAKITNDSIYLIPGFDPRQRPMGLSYTPVLFATQTCIALAAVMYIRIVQGKFRDRGIDWLLIAVSLALLALCVVTGNRSPTLGIGVFIIAYLLFRVPALAGLIIPAALIAAGILAFNTATLERTGLRVARTVNSSSENRSTLRSYGTFLIERRPIGYGLTFDSTTKWPVFYQQAMYMPNPDSIRNWALHNYYLAILNKYGLLLLFLLPWILPRRREHFVLWFAFVPYMVHIFYHNDGPLQGDFLVFYAIAAAMMLLRRPELFHANDTGRRPNPWRRAFAPRATPIRRAGLEHGA